MDNREESAAVPVETLACSDEGMAVLLLLVLCYTAVFQPFLHGSALPWAQQAPSLCARSGTGHSHT